MEKRYDKTILATALIPWNENYSFLKELFTEQLHFLISKNIKHIYLFGTAGEGYAVNNSQFSEIVRVFSEAMKGDGLHPMVGVIDLSSSRINEKIDIAHSYGIREFQVSLPCWGELTFKEITGFMDSVLSRRKDCRFLFYNLQRTKRMLEVDELFILSERYENLCAVKQTRLTDEDIWKIEKSHTPLQFFVTERNYHKLSKAAECGLLLSLGNLHIESSWNFFNGNDDDFLTKLNQIHEKMLQIGGKGLIDGAYDKLYVKYHLPKFPLRLLKPYKSFTDEMYKEFKLFTDSCLKQP